MATLTPFNDIIRFATNPAEIVSPDNPFTRLRGGNSLQISELEGSNPRTFTLQGRAMPYREVEWEGRQRTRRQYYPGSGVATQQILGPTEETTEFVGFWKDRFVYSEAIAIDPPPLLGSPQTAEALVEVFHDLRRKGGLLRVQYASEVRTGILVRFTPKYHRVQDIEWSMEFEWQSRNDDVPRRAAVPPLSAELGFDLFNAIDDLLGTLEFGADLFRAFVAAIASTIAAVGDFVSRLIDLLRVAETLVNLPGTLVGAIRNTAIGLIAQLGDVVRRIAGPRRMTTEAAPALAIGATNPTSRSSSATGSKSRQGAAPPASSVTDQARFEALRKSIARGAERLRGWAVDQLAGIEARVLPKAVTVVTVAEATSLYTLSTRAYGSPDFAGYLQAANQLPSLLAPAGFQLRVPPKPNVAGDQVDPLSATWGGLGNTSQIEQCKGC